MPLICHAIILQTKLAKRIEYQPNQVFAGQAKSGPFPLKEWRSYERVEGGTRFNLAFEFQPSGLLRLAGLLFMSMLKRQTESDLTRLKELMETRAS
jgi:hypothetical protein